MSRGVRPAAAGAALVTMLAVLHAVASGSPTGPLRQVAFTIAALAAGATIIARALMHREERPAWLALGLALLANMTADALLGWDALGAPGWVPVAGALAAAAAFAGSLVALRLMLHTRVTGLRLTDWLDGMVAALGLQLVILLVLSLTTRMAAPSGAALAAPLADVLVVGVIAGAAARDGWRLEGWGLILGGLACVAIGDVVEAVNAGAGGSYASAATNLPWLAGAWLLAGAAWAPAPTRRSRTLAREWVPVAFGALALALLASGLASGLETLIRTLAIATLAAVIVRFNITLRMNRSLLRQTHREARTDALTGLGNRRQLIDDLEAALAGGVASEPATLALFDLNGFKSYNDVYGHQAGDGLLSAIGTRLAVATDGVGTAYRMGGDEFCVLLGTVEDAAEVAARAAAALTMRSSSFTVTAAHGLVALPREASTASTALRLADRRMYEKKSGGRVGPSRQVAGALSLALEERDPELHSHMDVIQGIAAEIGDRLGLDGADVERVRLAAALHDTGKIAIPEAILRKAAPLTDLERGLIRRHPLTGQRIVESAPALRDVAALVRSVHERPDGQGYPDGLRGEAIPLGSRIVGVVVAYHAMISDRPYRAALTPAAAREELIRCAGTQFDAAVVDVFLEACPQAMMSISASASTTA